MRVYLVYSDVSSNHGIPYHPGLASIAAVLREAGHDIQIGYLDSVEHYNDIVDAVESFEADVVGFTSVETQFVHVQRLAALIKAKRDCVTVCGGTYMTLAPEVVLEPESSSLDGIIRGDGEYALLELTEKLGRDEDYHGIDNFTYVDPRTGRLVQNPLRPAIENLESIPHPATDLFEYQAIIDDHQSVLFHFSRGCPYPCTYCAARTLMLEYGQSVRYRSVDSAIEEVELTVKNYRVNPSSFLWFTDDLFCLNKKWLYEFLAKYERKIGLPFSCNVRSNLVNDEMFNRMVGAGCKYVMMSIESGNDYIRNEVMKRVIPRKEMFQSFELANRYGLQTCAPVVIGVPFETPEMLEDSIKTVAQLHATEYGCNIFYPYRGTPLRAVCEENGFMPDSLGTEANDVDRKLIHERKESILNLPTLTKDEILHYNQNWTDLVTRQMPWRDQAAYGMRRAYGKFFHMDKKLPKVKAFLDGNKYAHGSRRLVAKTLGF